jgi:phosphoglycolate phosphatase
MACVIFDLDGTLADTSRDLIAAANSCFRGLGLGDVLDPVADAATALRGGRAMLALGFQRTQSHDPAEIDRQYPVLLEAYGRDLDRHTVLYPGAIAAVRRLRAAGIPTGICTNKPAALAEELMRRLGVRGDFDALVGADTLPVRKPDPAPYLEAVRRAGGTVGRSLLVGDTVTDRDTARAAGVPSVLVTFGPLGGSVADLAPEGLIGHFDELWDEVRRLLA